MATTWKRRRDGSLTGDEKPVEHFALDLALAAAQMDSAGNMFGIYDLAYMAQASPHLLVWAPKHFLIGEEDYA